MLQPATSKTYPGLNIISQKPPPASKPAFLKEGDFEFSGSWTPAWAGMPEYAHGDLTPWKTVYVHFECEDDIKAFAAKLGQSVKPTTRAIWYPPQQKLCVRALQYGGDPEYLPRYPIYIVSKGRWESRLTSRALERMRVPYRIVIEPQEYKHYAAVINPKKILRLPFSNLGQGSIPARNWIWEHSMDEGHRRHWILDDNILGFHRYNRNRKTLVNTGATFCAAEDFTDRYANVGIAGMQYFMFVAARTGTFTPPFVTNTRIYSCILLRNDLPFRWRGRYNEDTDLSIRVLKSGQCTILFNAFLAEKQATMTMKGGNTDELYAGDGRLKMAQSLCEQHPDISKITRKWGRYQHQVDYSRFKRNKLILRKGKLPEGDNDYGMKLMVKTTPSNE